MAGAGGRRTCAFALAYSITTTFAEQTGHMSTVDSPFIHSCACQHCVDTEAQGLDTWHSSVVQQVES